MMRVTEVLRLSGLRPPMTHVADVEWYLQRGSAIHAAIALSDQGKLDFDSLDERIKPFVAAQRKFRQECGGKLVATEQEVKKDGIVGHFDAIYLSLKIKGHKGKRCLVDWKTNEVDAATSVQTAAYVNMAENYICKYISHRCGIALHDDGTYKITWFNDWIDDIHTWFAAIRIAEWKQRNNIKE